MEVPIEKKYQVQFQVIYAFNNTILPYIQDSTFMFCLFSMYVVHCHYPNRQIKRLIQQLVARWIPRISKINYSKSYIPDEKKTLVVKESVLHIYANAGQDTFIKDFLQKNMADCFTVFIDHKSI